MTNDAQSGQAPDYRLELATALFQASHGANLITWSDETRDYWLKRADAALATPPSPALDAATIERIIRNEVGDVCYDDVRWLSNRQIVERCLRAAFALINAENRHA